MKKILSLITIVLLFNLAIVSAAELVEKNNSHLPDLAVKKVQVQKNGSDATIKIQIKNYGRSNIEGFWYYVNYGDSTGEYIFFEETIRPRQTKNIRLTHTYTSNGSYEGMVNLDPIYMIEESNEENNIKEFTLNIRNSGSSFRSKIRSLRI